MVQGAEEALDVRAADGAVGLVPLGLDVDPTDAEAVLVDHPVKAAVAGTAQVDRGLVAASVAHRDQEPQNSLLQELRRRRMQPLDQLGGDVGVQLLDGRADLLQRGLVHVGPRHRPRTRRSEPSADGLDRAWKSRNSS